MTKVGRKTRALLLEQRLTKCRTWPSSRLYRARLLRYSLNWKVMVF